MSIALMTHEYQGGGFPETVGDRYYAQDVIRDHWHLKDKVGRAMQALFEKENPLVSRSELITQGSNFTRLDIPSFFGYCLYDVTVPDSFAALPPTTKTEQGMLPVEVPSIIDYDTAASGATLDGVTVNYIKASYDYTVGPTRNRAKVAGSYAYEVSDSYVLACNPSAPTTYQVTLGEYVSDGASFGNITTYQPEKIQSGTKGELPIGYVVWFPGNGALEDGIVECNGALLAVLDFPDCFARLGYTWGGATTTFGIPNLQGIHPGAFGTQDFNGTGRIKGFPESVIGEYVEDKFQGHEHKVPLYDRKVDSRSSGINVQHYGSGSRTTTDIFTKGTSGAPRYGATTDVSRAIGRWVIRVE